MAARKTAKKKAAPAKKKAAPAKKKAAPAKKKAAPAKKKAAPAKKKAAPAKKKAAPRADDAKAFAPGQLVTHPSGEYSLIFSDFPHAEIFEEHGTEGGGYTWHGLVDHLLRLDAPEHLRALQFDPEGSMFAVASRDLAALAAVGEALAKLQNPTLLRKLVATVDLSEFD
jgi:hypothetical protein